MNTCSVKYIAGERIEPGLVVRLQNGLIWLAVAKTTKVKKRRPRKRRSAIVGVSASGANPGEPIDVIAYGAIAVFMPGSWPPQDRHEKEHEK